MATLAGDQAGSQCELEVELEPVLGGAVRQANGSLDAVAQMDDRLDIGKARGGDFAGAQPITRCLVGQPEMPKTSLNDAMPVMANFFGLADLR